MPRKPPRPPTQHERDRALPITVQAKQYLVEMMSISEQAIHEDHAEELGANQLYRHLVQFGKRVEDGGRKQPGEIPTRRVKHHDTTGGPF